MITMETETYKETMVEQFRKMWNEYSRRKEDGIIRRIYVDEDVRILHDEFLEQTQADIIDDELSIKESVKIYYYKKNIVGSKQYFKDHWVKVVYADRFEFIDDDYVRLYNNKTMIASCFLEDVSGIIK